MSKGRTCSVDVRLKMHNDSSIETTGRITSAHLFAESLCKQSAYVESLGDVFFLCRTKPTRAEYVIGADVQDRLGPFDELLF